MDTAEMVAGLMLTDIKKDLELLKRLKLTSEKDKAVEDNSGKELADKTHEGFEITCKQCGSNVIIVESDVGFSAMSGGWGGVSL